MPLLNSFRRPLADRLTQRQRAADLKAGFGRASASLRSPQSRLEQQPSLMRSSRKSSRIGRSGPRNSGITTRRTPSGSRSAASR